MTVTPEVCSAALYPNPATRSSGKTGRFPHLKLARELARQVGLVETWPNIHTVRLAITSEAAFSGVDASEAFDVILRAAQERSCGPQYSYPAEWEKREIYRENSVDRFWFEDARWRSKFVYLEFRQNLRERMEPAS